MAFILSVCPPFRAASGLRIQVDWVSVKVKDDGMVLTLNHSNPRNGMHEEHGKTLS